MRRLLNCRETDDDMWLMMQMMCDWWWCVTDDDVIVAKQYVLLENCLNKWKGCPMATLWY